MSSKKMNDKKKNVKRGEDNTIPYKNGDYKDKIRAHRYKTLYRILLGVVLVVIVALIIRVQNINHVYTGYEVVNSVDRTASYDSTDIRLGQSILTYDKDGAHCQDAIGSVLWNQTYEMQDIKIDTNGNVVGIGNYNGRNIFVLNERQQISTISTTMPIRNLCVSETGTCTVVMYDTDVTYLYTYNSDGEMIVKGQNYMSNSGYPAAIGLSPNGKLLMVGYMHVDAGAIVTSISFFNFGAVGENYTDHMVSGFDYIDTIVPEVGFLSNSTAYAIGDSRIMFYTGDEQPTTKAEYLLDKEILSVFANNGHLGVVFGNNNDEGQYRMSVYNSNGDLQGEYCFDLDYRDIFFEKNTFVVYNESECLVRTYDGKDKFAGRFDTGVKVMLPTDKPYKYIIADDKSIKTIQLN